MHSVTELIEEFDRSQAYTLSLWSDLNESQVHWRADENASGIGWHLGHQAAVAHFLVRNLTAAEPSLDTELDKLMDSATPEAERGKLSDLQRLADYRSAIAERVRFRIGNIDSGNVGAPTQLRTIATGLLTTVINHEYQHSKWIGEVRNEVHCLDLAAEPASKWLTFVDGYVLLT
jgi:hypothetical protein